MAKVTALKTVQRWNGDYKIEKNIPIPEKVRGTIYPFDEMNKGDSFFYPRKTAGGVISAARKRGVKVTVRAENGGFRVWRVS